MEKFNFDVPINATVIFDDSDDEVIETKQSLENLINELETKKNSPKDFFDLEVEEKQINSDLFKAKNCIKKDESKNGSTKSKTSVCTNDLKKQENSRNTIKHPEKVKSAKKPIVKQKPLDMPSLDEECFTSENISCSLSAYESHKEISTHNKTDHQREKKRKESTDKQKKSKRRSTQDTQLNADQDINEEETHLKSSNVNQMIQNFDLQGGIKGTLNASDTEGSLSKSPKQNMMPVECYSVNNEINPNIVQHHNQEQPNPDTSTVSQSLHESDQSVSSYLKELLNTVSEHLINIFTSYQSYVRICKAGCDRSLIEHAKNNFISTRIHFFDLSYSSVVNIIMPRHDDATFVKNFIENTNQIAASKSHNYSNINLKPLYLDMIHWVKKKQEAIQTMNINKLSCPLLSQELQKPVKPPTISLSQDRQTCKTTSTFSGSQTVYSAVPPEQNMYFEQTLNDRIGCRIPYCPCVELESQNLLPSKLPPYPNQHQQINQSRKTLNRNIAQPSRPPGQTAHYNNPTYYSKEAGSKQTFCPVLMPPENSRTNYKQQFYEKQVQDNNNNWFHNTQNYNIRALQNMDNPKNNNINEKLPPFSSQSWQKQTPQYWQNDWANTPNKPQNHQNLDLWQANLHSHGENLTQAEQNRSISRDSGFISPLNFNSSSDQPYSVQAQNLQSTPLITHVTSMNPNVSYITDGYCAVCGKITKQMCIGCYKCYYCSHDCQLLDWKNHQLICK